MKDGNCFLKTPALQTVSYLAGPMYREFPYSDTYISSPKPKI